MKPETLRSLERADLAVAAARDAIRDMRLALAIERDNQLTKGELIAVLEVYEEFGR